VLRSSIREFLCSEAMWALGVPTTRAGTLVLADTKVERDRMYSGDVKWEPCAVVLRGVCRGRGGGGVCVCMVAPSFVRLGSFQICMESEDREGPSLGLDAQMLPPLLRHVISRHFPHIATACGDDAGAQYRAYFTELTERVADCTALWQTVGFCHGVLNTDNVSAIGVTIDYGPFGFVERFDRDYICNTSDNAGRYSYANQPSILEWNLRRLAAALGGLAPVVTTEQLDGIVSSVRCRASVAVIARVRQVYMPRFQTTYRRLMRRKLGLIGAADTNTSSTLASSDDASDDALFARLFELMEHSAVDFTNTFRMLAMVRVDGSADEVACCKCVFVLRLGFRGVCRLGWMQCTQQPAIATNVPPNTDPLCHSMYCGACVRCVMSVTLTARRQYVQIANQYPIGLYQMGKSFEWLEKEIKNRGKYDEVRNATVDVQAERAAWRAWLAQYRAVCCDVVTSRTHAFTRTHSVWQLLARATTSSARAA
jgi:uncharacterized protein YdiU (UPF0061 family)